MSQSSGSRVISKLVEGLGVEYTQSSTTWAINAATNATGWLNVGNGIFQWRGYIDLTGYRPDDMVFKPAAVQLQYGANFYSFGATSRDAGGSIHLQYAMTTDKVDDIDYGIAGVAEPLVGFIGDNSEMEQVIFSGSESWGPALTAVSMVNHQSMQFGDGPPIVSQRVYLCIRMQLLPAILPGEPEASFGDTTFYVPPMRFVMAGEVAEIEEYRMLHLMKRQVDLQQTPDVDE